MAGREPSCCYLNGTIDEVRVWNTALSAGTITAWKDRLPGSCHPDIANLVLYWPLDDNANPATATAESGTAYTRRLLVKGNNRIALNIASLPSGIYIIEVGDGKAIVEKYKVLKRWQTLK